MDQPLFAHNKSVMDSNSFQKTNVFGQPQSTEQTGHPTFHPQVNHPSSGPYHVVSNSNTPARPPHPQQSTTNQVFNAPQYGHQNGFQNDTNHLARFPASFGQAPNMPLPHAPLQRPPTFGPPFFRDSSQSQSQTGIGYPGTAQLVQRPPFSETVNFHAAALPPFPVPSNNQGFPVRPPLTPQSHLHAPVSTSASNFHTHPPPPPKSSSFNGPYSGVANLPTNQMFVSPSHSSTGSGSHQASRSETPVVNSPNYDNLEGQFLSQHSSPNDSLNQSLSGAPLPNSQPVYFQNQMPPPPPPSVDSSHFNYTQIPPPSQHQAWSQQQPWQQQPHQQQQQLWQQQPQVYQQAAYHALPGSLDALNLNQQAPQRVHNLLQERNLIPKEGFQMNEPVLNSSFRAINCSPEIISCTLNAIPNSQSLLKKTKLPLGLLLHPFKDLSHLPIVQSSVIVRCRSCRTYINCFVTFVDPGRWKCNICEKINEVPVELTYDTISKSYGEPLRRPEVRSATIEYIAPSEYLVRPPMPAVYLFLLDVSHNAIETGYLKIFCETLLEELDKVPGDGRKQVGFIAFDSSLYFFNLSDEFAQPQLLVIPDLDDPSQPCPDGLLVNLHQSKQMITDLLQKLPLMFQNNPNAGNALGSALEVATKMVTPSGGRISVFQTHLPTIGPGSLTNREESNERITKNIHCLGPATDFYKKIALDCSAQQIAIDVFFLNSQFCDVATICGATKYTGGCMHYFPGFHATLNPAETKRFKSIFSRYLTRKIGFEAVMRIRCTKGISLQTYHGNFFVRSTDLLSLPNINPDAGFAVHLSIDDNLDCNFVSFQTAILYTSSKAERRIRVHTLCVPVSSVQSEIESSSNQLAIVGLLSKMAVDKSLNVGLGDSREALVNAAVDILNAFSGTLSPGQRVPNQVLAPNSLGLVPLLILALLKSMSFRIGIPTRIDDRVVAMEMCKNLPLRLLILHIYPYLYPIHNLDEKVLKPSNDQKTLSRPPIILLSSTQLDRHGAYLMDTGSYIYLYLGPAIIDVFCNNLLNVASFSHCTEGMIELPELDNPLSKYVRDFIAQLGSERPFFAPLILIREDSKLRNLFYQHLVEDKTESSFSYQEFLLHIQREIKT